MSNGVQTSEYPSDATIVDMLRGLQTEIEILTALEAAYPLSAEVTREKTRIEAAARKLEAGPTP